MKLIRKIHFYLGTFFAPSIIFFALSGAFQIVGLHEGDGAIGWVARMAQVHKSQTIEAARARPPKPPEAPHVDAAPAPARPAGPARSQLLILFFVLMAVSLIVSSCLGVYMAFQYKRDRRVIFGLLAAGVVLPILFLLI